MIDLRVKSVPALERALLILERLATSQRGISLTELSRDLKLPKSSVFGLLATLERKNYVGRNDHTRCYNIGVKLLTLAEKSLASLELRHYAAPLLRALADNSRLTVNMAILEQNEAVFIEKITPFGQYGPPTWIGKHMDLNCTAVGKVLLAYLPQGEVNAFISRYGLPKHNDNAASSPSRFQEELRKVRRLGYALNDEENDVGFRAIAVPIFVADGMPAIAAISLAGTTDQIDPEDFAELASMLKKTAICIAQRLSKSGLAGSAEKFQCSPRALSEMSLTVGSSTAPYLHSTRRVRVQRVESRLLSNTPSQ